METWVREFEGHRSKVFEEDFTKGEQGESKEGEEKGTEGEQGESQEGEEKGKEEMEKTVEEEGKKPEEKCLKLEDTCMVVECTLDEVEDALRVSIKHLQCVKEIVKKGREGEKEFFNEMCAFYIMLVGMKEKKLMPGEWLERKLSFLQTHCKGTEMDIIVNIIKECMRDVYPNVPIFLTE